MSQFMVLVDQKARYRKASAANNSSATKWEACSVNSPPKLLVKDLSVCFAWAGNWKHVLTVSMQLDVMAPAEPSDVQRLVISIMMRIDSFCATDFAGFLLDLP